MSGSRVFGRASRHAKRDVRANEHGAARFRYEGGHRTVPKGVARWSPRWEATTYECSSWNGFGVQKSIGRIAGRDARGRYQAHLGYARPSRKDSHARRLTRSAAKTSGDNGARAFEVPPNHGDATLVQTARASLVGIASGGVRARGLGRSQGRERAVTDTMEGCPGRGCAPLNQGCNCGSGLEGQCPANLTARGAAGGAATEVRAPVPSRRRRHSEVGTVSVAPPAALSFGRHGAGGRHPRRGAPHLRSRRRRCEAQGVRARGHAGRSLAGRRATRGVRRDRID